MIAANNSFLKTTSKLAGPPTSRTPPPILTHVPHKRLVVSQPVSPSSSSSSIHGNRSQIAHLLLLLLSSSPHLLPTLFHLFFCSTISSSPYLAFDASILVTFTHSNLWMNVTSGQMNYCLEFCARLLPFNTQRVQLDGPWLNLVFKQTNNISELCKRKCAQQCSSSVGMQKHMREKKRKHSNSHTYVSIDKGFTNARK